MSAIEPLGVIHGRFQPLHVGHVEYLLAAKALCSTLIVGITNPDPASVKHEPSDPARGEDSANPCTFYERLLMVEGALLEAGVSRESFRIVPFPHSFPERLRHYAPSDALYFLSIYGQWGESKLRRFADLGLRTHVLWRRETTVTSGTEIRRCIVAGSDYQKLVPAATARVLRECGIDTRIRAAHAGGEQRP